MVDRLLERLLYQPSDDVTLETIPFPKGLAPTYVSTYTAHSNMPLPKADVLIVTWTAAEFKALADVWTPGHKSTDWQYYSNDFESYESQLTGRSPAKDAKRLGEYALVTVGTKRVILFHSQLHLSTDGNEPPIVKLWQQIITQTRPSLIITTGTAGGIGMSESLGDVFICNSAKFNCTETFKDKSWAQQRFSNGVTITGANLELARTSLVQINAVDIPATYAPRNRSYCGHQVILFVSDNTGDVETVDYFGFDDTDDSYDIVANDSKVQTEEMDDATLPLALSTLETDYLNVTPWLSVRNASDPEVPSSIGTLEEQKTWAADIYQKYGYWTTVGSAITCWALVADFNG